MRILVAGSQGQLARCLVELHGKGGLEIMLAGRPQLDLLRPATIEETLDGAGPDAVINTAAYTAVDKAESHPAEAGALNADGAEALARGCDARQLPLIHVSTDYVFDGTSPKSYRESDATAPLGVYGRSKLEGEVLVARVAARHVIVRTSWLMSAHGNNFLKTMLRLAADRDELRVVADQWGSPTYGPDLATALVAVAQAMRGAARHDARWGTYHAANSGVATWHDVAVAIVAASADRAGRHVPVRAITTADYPTPAARPRRSVLDCGKLRERFGISLPDWRSRIVEGVERVMRAPAQPVRAG